MIPTALRFWLSTVNRRHRLWVLNELGAGKAAHVEREFKSITDWNDRQVSDICGFHFRQAVIAKKLAALPTDEEVI